MKLFENRYNILVISIVLLAFLSVSFARIRTLCSDPDGAVQLAETICNFGTIKLDHYGSKTLQGFGYRVQKKNGHYYYYFPIGTPIACIPFVAIANGWGVSMVGSSGSAVQVGITSITAVLTLIFLIMLARIFLPPLGALLISTVFWFGTSFASTCGTALWSHNFAALFALIAIYITIKVVTSKNTNNWPKIAIFLFSAYLCRPTMSLLIPFVLLFIFTYNKAVTFKVVVLLLILMSCFIVFSIHEFNQFLPDYYMPQRLNGGQFWTALYGNLLSPSRGLLIYSPFILIAWLCFGSSTKEFKLKTSWLLIGIAWPVLHLICISRFPHWWGGWSYGPRLMTDVLPGLFLLNIRTWPVITKSFYSKLAIIILTGASLFAIYINTYQGLFNTYNIGYNWNAEPSVDTFPEYIFNWKYPQFMDSHKRHELRLIDHNIKYLEPILPNELLAFNSTKLLFINWSGLDNPVFRWSKGKSVKILFILNSREKANFKGGFSMNAGALGRQRLNIYLNDTKIYEGQLYNWDQNLDFKFDPSLLKERENFLRFDLPDSRQPGNGDLRVLALRLKSFYLN
jgi:hypothetical protein